MKFVNISISLVFASLSPMVRVYLKKINNDCMVAAVTFEQFNRIEKELKNVSFYIPMKYSLQIISEARLKENADDKLTSNLINEINAVHTQCDRLINSRHETFSKGLTIGCIVSLYTYFIVRNVRLS